jgi:anti-sigma factor RsiW
MSHDRYPELLALRLYGELDAAAAAELDAHLHACAACRRLERELGAGLGALAPGPAADDLPAGWEERLRGRLADAPRGRGALLRLFAPAAAFAAGVLVTAALRPAPPRPGPTQAPPVAAAAFERESPPPPAPFRGQLARWDENRR